MNSHHSHSLLLSFTIYIHCLTLLATAGAKNLVLIACFGEALGRVLWLPARSASLARFAPCFAQCNYTLIVGSKVKQKVCGVK